MFSEETDWCYRFRQAGWKVLFTPDAEFVHVGGATTRRTGGRCSASRCGVMCASCQAPRPTEAERARRLLLVSMRLRGVDLPRGARAHLQAEAARWLAALADARAAGDAR